MALSFYRQISPSLRSVDHSASPSLLSSHVHRPPSTTAGLRRRARIRQNPAAPPLLSPVLDLSHLLTLHRPPTTVDGGAQAWSWNLPKASTQLLPLSLTHAHTHTYILCDLAWPLSARFVASTVVGKWVHSGAAADLGDAYQEQ